MAAKMVAKKNSDLIRDDWDSVRVAAMYWCVSLKVLQNWDQIIPILKEAGSRHIVEKSTKDQFWGCKEIGDEFVGVNALGRIWDKIITGIKNGNITKETSQKAPFIRNNLFLGKTL